MENDISNDKGHKFFQLTSEALDFIESNLSEPISVKDVTAQFEKSHWQFQRLFSSVTGVSMGQYLRERRLAEACRQLEEGKDRLLDIAVQYDFGSEEAFSRSFKNFFGINPSDYRKSENLVLREARNKICSEKLEYFWKNVQRAPSLVHCDEKTLVGMSIEFASHFILGTNCHSKVVPHWIDFKKRIDLIPNRANAERIGVVMSTELELREEKLTYFAGVEVTAVENLMECMHPVVLPSGLYACFENKTLSEKNGHLIDYIYGIWLPGSDYVRAPGFDYEIFDHRYVQGDPNSFSRFYVPVAAK